MLSHRRLAAATGALVAMLGGCNSAGVTDPPPPLLIVRPVSATLIWGQRLKLTASVQNGARLSADDVAWSSSNATVATATGGGIVQGVSVGTADIVATWAGLRAVATLTVTESTGSGSACPSLMVTGTGLKAKQQGHCPTTKGNKQP
jgi:hypothetical protein